MNLQFNRNRRRDGGALVFTVLTVAVLCFLMASYLSLVGATNQSSFRSLAWNSAIPVVEAGIEEALAHLNKNGSVSLIADGWTQDSSGYSKRLQLGDAETYSQTHISLNTPRVIQAQGFVRVPLSAWNYVSRKVEVNTRLDSLFTKALASKSQVDLHGNNLRVDSFNSVNPSFSTGGLYDPYKSEQKGDIAATAGLVNSQNIGSAEVYGNIATGPGGTVALGTQGLMTGTVTDDMNVTFPDVERPFATAPSPSFGMFTPPSGHDHDRNGSGGGYTLVLSSGDWQINGNLSMSGSYGHILVTGNARLLVTGDVNLTSTAAIEIATNATLKLYVGGATAILGGTGIVNDGGNASQFQYYGLPTNTRVDYQGTTPFTGVIYAPNADLTLGNGGSNTYEFVGAATTKSTTLNGHHNMHYDENLSHSAPFRGYVAVSWNEI